MIGITKSGYFYILMTLVIGFSAVNTGNNLVYIIAAALLSYMVASGILGHMNLLRIQVSLSFPEEIFAGIEFPVKVSVRNMRKSRPAFLLQGTIMGRSVLFPLVQERSLQEKTLMLTLDKRGRNFIHALELSSPFPFNLFTRYRTCPLQVQLIVYPRPLPGPDLVLRELISPRQGDRFSSFPGHDADILSIRDYTAGDPLKTIHWKATARTGILKTKELAALQYHNPTIHVEQIQGDELEKELSHLTHLILKISRSRSPIVVIMDNEKLQPGLLASHKHQLLRKLALYHET